jgi:hypothetical protein
VSSSTARLGIVFAAAFAVGLAVVLGLVLLRPKPDPYVVTAID